MPVSILYSKNIIKPFKFTKDAFKYVANKIHTKYGKNNNADAVEVAQNIIIII